MPIRVMHVINDLTTGGLENGVVNLIRHMDPSRFEHVVCTIRGLGCNLERLPLDRVAVTCLAGVGATTRFQTRALAQVIRHTRPDIVHSRNWATIEAVPAGRLARASAVVHSEHGFEATASTKEPWRRIVFRRIAYELADRVLTMSSQLRDLHAHRTGFPARRITVIHNGVAQDRFFPDENSRRRIRHELHIRESDFCIGCVANLLPVKDHLTLLRAFGRAAAAGDGWRLLLVGEGPERARLEAFVEEHPAWRARVSFLGSSSCVPDLLRAFDVFVLPSVAEGICNSLLEAMATGVPVVATRVGGTPEVVVDGESGLLFPVGDADALSGHLLDLSAHPERRAALGAGGLARVQRAFSIESMVRAYERLYLDVIPGASVPAFSAS